VEVYDEPDVRVDPDPPVREPDGGIPDLEDTGLDNPDFLACAERPLRDCTGANDFPCGFEPWVERSAERCQLLTGCRTDDWLSVTMNDDGCVSAIGMTEPKKAFVAC
jgi:hypothetical protein